MMDEYKPYAYASQVCVKYTYSATCSVNTLVSGTRVSTYSWLVSTPHSAPSSCTLCQPVLMASTSDKRYRFGQGACQASWTVDANGIMVET